MRFITRDYETYWASDYTLSKLSTSAYVFDPRFQVILVSVKVGRGKAVYMTPTQWRAFVESIRNTIGWDQVGILGHHNQFDGMIDAHHYGIKPGLWFDTLSMSRALSGPHAGHDLDTLAKRYGVGEKGKEILNTRGFRLEDFSPEQYARYGEYSINDTDLTFDIFNKMLEKGFPRSELELIDTTIRMFTEPKFVLDEEMMREYLVYEVRRKEELMQQVGLDRKTIGSDEKLAEAFRKFLPDSVDAPRKVTPKGNTKYAFAKTDPGFKDLLENENDEIRWLAEARVGIKSTLNETRTGRMLALGLNGRQLPVYLNYYGAHTGRWSGGDKVNMQNFERTSKTNARKGTIRKAIRAPKGKKIVVADSGQIEARTVGWLAYHDVLLDQFIASDNGTGLDVYSAFASDAFGRPVDRKKVKTDQAAGHIGKCMVLGLGYQMGFLKFAGELLKGMLGADPVKFTETDIEKLGIDPTQFFANSNNVKQVTEMQSRLPIKDRLIHCCVAHHFVQVYRAKNKPIKELWAYCEEIIKMMIGGYEGPVFRDGIVTMKKHDLILPNGLALKYSGICKTEGGYEYFNGRHMTNIYGGLLTENLTQALDRIVVADQMQSLVPKYPGTVATMSHDEIVSVIDEARAPILLHDKLTAMKVSPRWALSLPLNAEGGIGDTYGSAKD